MMSQGGGAGGTGGGGVCLNYTTFKNTLQEIYDKTKIPLVISEYDIATEDDQVQLQCYKEQITAFMEAPYVAGITLWGYIYGSTWTTNGNSGIIKNGADRPAMTWLKDYLSKNKGVNTTGIGGGSPVVVVPPVKQAPYKGVIAIPGTVEAENYDVGSPDTAYYDSESANQGAVYRQDQVDIVAVPNGYAVGYTANGEWLEYTVNVSNAGIYTYEASAASGGDGSSFRLFLDGKAITDTIKVTNGGNWDTYSTATGNTVALTAGSHILKIAFTGGYANIDKIKFSPITTRISGFKSNLAQGIQEFAIHNVNGTWLSSFQAGSVSDLKVQMQSSSLNRGLYLVRSKNASSFLIHVTK
jgi:hypothetical protein